MIIQNSLIKSNELYHYGIPERSGRYGWGSGDRPYQRLEESRKRRFGISSIIKNNKDKKNEALKKEREKNETERKKEFEKNKDRIIKSAGPEEVMKYQGLLTNSELQEISNRLRLESEIKRYYINDNKKEDPISRLKKLQSYTNVSSSLAKDGISIWNSFAAVYNSTENGKNNPLPFISTGGGDQKKKEKNRE